MSKKPLGCNENLGRGLCGEISFVNKIILCDDCTFKIIENRAELQIALKDFTERVDKLLCKKYSKEDQEELLQEMKKLTALTGDSKKENGGKE